MGTITNKSSVSSITQFEIPIAYVIKQKAKEECVDLIVLAHKNYITDNEKVFSIEETIITAGIFKHLEILVETNEQLITITPERYEYTIDIKNGKVNPKKAKRLDLYFEHLNMKPYLKTKFSVEAKLLAEVKTNKKTLNYWIDEYVGIGGMGKFINQNYASEGFMLGYILNGNTSNIFNNINTKIIDKYSVNETLKPVKNYFISNYNIECACKELYHIFLSFDTVS